MAIVAIPAFAIVEATANGLLFLLSPKPCPKIATGQPPAGCGPDGRKRLKYTAFVPWTAGDPVSVPVGGITFAAVS
jgi:hypothetical protein